MRLRKKPRYGFLAGLFLTALLFSGCIKVVSTDPANGATDVDRNAIITVTFAFDSLYF